MDFVVDTCCDMVRWLKDLDTMIAQRREAMVTTGALGWSVPDAGDDE